jgi:hypothetical protein
MERAPEVQRLIDEAAIHGPLAQYPHATDRQDHELLASLFIPTRSPHLACKTYFM